MCKYMHICILYEYTPYTCTCTINNITLTIHDMYIINIYTYHIPIYIHTIGSIEWSDETVLELDTVILKHVLEWIQDQIIGFVKVIVSQVS